MTHVCFSQHRFVISSSGSLEPESFMLSQFGIEAKHPDDFVLEVLHLAPGAVCGAVSGQVAALKNPPRLLADVLETFQANGLPRSVARLRELFGVTVPTNL